MIPDIGLGTWQLRGTECISAVKTALNLGYKHIDTAEFYENEAQIGQAINDRKKLFITSKVSPHHLKYDDVITACNNSLSKLRTDYLDLYLIHWPNPIIKLEETFSAFDKLLEEGKIKSYGVSNFNIEYLKKALAITNKIITNQVEFHPLLYQKELLEFCSKNNVKITAYCPLARGLVMKNETLIFLAKRYNKTPAQISLRWLLQKGTIVIPKSSSEQHLRENLDVKFELTNEDMEKIDEIDMSKRLVPLGN